MSMKHRMDFTSRFICTVYKPLYYILLPLIFSIVLDIFTTIPMNINVTAVYWIIISLVFALIFIEYIICRAIKKKRGTIKEKQLTVKEKVKVLIAPLTITLVLMVVVPLIHVKLFSGI